MSKKIFVAIVIVLLVASLAVFADSATIKDGGTLRIAYSVGSNLVPNFNPFSPNAVYVLPAIYEPLFWINGLTGETTDFLGTSYKWEDDNLQLIVTTRQGVKWSDGIPFTAQDVAFTFNYMKKYPAIDNNGIMADSSNLVSVKASGNNTVIFTFSKPNTAIFYYIAEQPIVPEHIWSGISNPSEWTNPNPVGTGPFLLSSIDLPNNTITLVKNPNYWMEGKPYIDKVIFSSLLSNTTMLETLLSGRADMGGGFIPNIQKVWADKNPSVNKYWWPANSINVLLMNTAKYPFNLPTFREAIAFGIDKQAIEERAYYNVGGVANPTGIISSQLDEWLDPNLTELANSFNFDPQKAMTLLNSIGFKKNSSGQLLQPNGDPLPSFKILVGAGWTDFITIAQIIQDNLKTLGITTTIDQESYGTYISSLMSGTYDMAVCWATGHGPTPYYFYYNEFNPAFSANKIGETAISDYSRYTNPLITAALQVYSSTSDLGLQKQAIYTIERIMLMDVPLIPLTGRTEFGEFSEVNFTGWPSNTNPYGGDSEIGLGTTPISGELILLNVHLK